MRALEGREQGGLALVAVGGYGRAELCPASDIDVMLLHEGGGRFARGVSGAVKGRRGRGDVEHVAGRLWYPIWDSGLKLGHAVRSVKEALALASEDLDTATALLDSRLVAGDVDLAATLATKAAAQWQSRSTRWLETLARSVEARHAKSGEVAFLLEPDLKEGRGGLRDVHALRWAEAARRILLDEDHGALDPAYATLLGARVELQRLTGKMSDVLQLQTQDEVAAALGHADADALMGSLAAAARTIAWTSDDSWQRIEAALRGPSGRSAGADRPLGPGLVWREGVVALAPDAAPGTDPTLALRAAAAAATSGTRLDRVTLQRLADGAPPMPDPWPDEGRRALLRLLGAGPDAIPVMESLDQKGLLERLVPEWSLVSSRPQRNAYHRFTVDRHLCEAAAEAAQRATRVRRPDLLLMGAWLHDIGKGLGDPGGRKHAETGAELAEQIGTRVGFPPQDVAVLVKLVLHHLLLPETATRRDIHDPATVAAVAEAVGDRETLDLLDVLTEADAVATGPAAWSPWKAGLVRELVAEVAAALAGEPRPAADAGFPTPAHRALIRQVVETGELALEASGGSLTLAAPDRPGLFSKVAGTLALNALDVLAARAWSTDDGVAVEDFRVEPLFGGEPDWVAVETDLRRVLAGRLSLEARLADRARTYGGRSRLPSATPARSLVSVDNDASASATVVEVRAPDRIAALYRITRALAELDLDIRHATVASLGHEVVDTFYVVDAAGAKLTDPDHVREVEGAVMVELARV